MLPPKTCIPKNYSCMAGLFGGLAAANQWKEDGDEEGDGLCESSHENHVVEERPRGRECFLKPPQSPTLRRRCKSLPTPLERAKLEIARSRSPSSHKKLPGTKWRNIHSFCAAQPVPPEPVLQHCISAVQCMWIQSK
ncbi:hypothetical protein SKAU_G00311050 [Synaphobranchus kaupii]|uniref:Uncharacterized protein n=1 Tax=Synaphobranchus kaupii TaxID=118154 RepID=A0A9Q1ERM5_SYNKA|nr:hypothetical protein SKAU_G00311050 [Synaphobranchus kaupii]